MKNFSAIIKNEIETYQTKNYGCAFGNKTHYARAMKSYSQYSESEIIVKGAEGNVIAALLSLKNAYIQNQTTVTISGEWINEYRLICEVVSNNTNLRPQVWAVAQPYQLVF